MKSSLALTFAFLALAATTACNNDTLTAAAQASPTPPAADSPVAIITGTQSYGVLDTAAFDGSTSYDPAGSPITAYAWSIASAPVGSQSQPVPVTGNPAQVNFFVDLAGDYSIQLTVTDAANQTGSTTYAFSAVPSQDLHVELLWPGQYTQVDMDLHLVRKSANGTLWNPLNDCYFGTCSAATFSILDWGVTGVTLDNPTLDIDNINTSTPENINIKKPADGTYSACVHYYLSHTATGLDIPVDNEVRIYLLGQQVFDQHKTLTTRNQVWYVGDIACVGGQCTVTPNGAIGTTFPGFPATAVCGP